MSAVIITIGRVAQGLSLAAVIITFASLYVIGRIILYAQFVIQERAI